MCRWGKWFSESSTTPREPGSTNWGPLPLDRFWSFCNLSVLPWKYYIVSIDSLNNKNNCWGYSIWKCCSYRMKEVIVRERYWRREKGRKLQLRSDAVNVHCPLLSQYGTADAEKTQKFLRMSRLKFNALNVHCPSSQTPVMLKRQKNQR